MPKRDINGCDVLFRALDTDDADAAQLSVQLKCTVNRLTRVAHGSELSFPLDAHEYNRLCMKPTHPPRMLVVVEAPHPSPTRWVEVSRKQLLVNASAWYAILAGEECVPDGQATKSVRIPVRQRFTPSTLRANMRSCP